MNPVLAYRTLCAFAERGSRWFGVLVYCFFAVPALGFLVVFTDLHAAPEHRLSNAFGSLLFAAMGNFFAWIYYPNNGLRLLLDARRLAMPSLSRAVLQALVWLSVVTILLPATFLAWYSGSHFPALLGVLASISFAGMLVTLMNFRVLLILWATAYAAQWLATFYGVQLPSSNLHFEQPVFGALSLAVAAVLATLCAFGWVRRLRPEDMASARSLLDLYLNDFYGKKLQGSALRLAGGATEASRGRSGPRLVDAGPADPVYAMGIWFAPPQARQLWRRLATNGAVIGWNLLLVGFASRLGITAFMMLAFASFGMSSFTAAGAPARRYLRLGSEVFSELALLPGWGDGQRARRIFLTVMLRPLLEFLAQATGVAAVTAFVFGLGPWACLTIINVGLVISLTSTACSLVTLVEREPERDFLFRLALCFALGVVAIVTGLWVSRQRPFWGPAAASIIVPVCLAWSIVMVGIVVHAYRRIAARPHPFLMP